MRSASVASQAFRPALLCRWSCFAGLGTLRFPRQLREPPGGVSLRSPGSPAFIFPNNYRLTRNQLKTNRAGLPGRCSAALRSAYARAWSLHLPIANFTRPRLVSPPAPQALPAPLCFASGLAPCASEPPAVSPCGPRSPPVSSGEGEAAERLRLQCLQ